MERLRGLCDVLRLVPFLLAGIYWVLCAVLGAVLRIMRGK